jgi:hypothetical protein
LPELSFPEDDTLSYAIANWYGFVNDPDQPVEELSYIVLPGSYVTAQQVDTTYHFTAPPDWFGRDTLGLVVSDGLAADTAALYINVTSVNDPPIISSLPDLLSFPADSTTTLKVWDFVSDVETPYSLLHYQFFTANDSLLYSYNAANGQLSLSAVTDFYGIVGLTFTVTDDSSATAADSLLVFVDEVTDISDPSAGNIPVEYVLMQNYPNPFNPATTIRYGIPKAEKVAVVIFNILGQKVRTLVSGKQEPGYYTLTWDSRDDFGNPVSSGLYFLRVTAGRQHKTIKIMLVK